MDGGVMVTREITEDEFYPVYVLGPVSSQRYRRSRIVELTVEELERYERVMAEFDALQEWLSSKPRR